MMVYEYIRQQMREGSLLPGSVLDLPAISHKLGISNTPLRDSLIRLEAEGYDYLPP
ncbi:MAG: GntR family transcriptional regulator [Bilophila wadsworthia]